MLSAMLAMRLSTLVGSLDSYQEVGKMQSGRGGVAVKAGNYASQKRVSGTARGTSKGSSRGQSSKTALSAGVDKFENSNVVTYQFESGGTPATMVVNKFSQASSDADRKVSFQVAGSFGRSESGGASVALKAARIFRHEVANAPEGTSYVTSAVGAISPQAYSRLGFSKAANKGEPQYAIKRGGKLVPATAAEANAAVRARVRG